ncbi:MAG: hypothetical protein ENTB_01368 [Enterocloster aldenensis]
MKFSEKLKSAMQQLEINQAKVVSLTGKSKGSISQYLSGKQTPSVEVQRDIAVSLGLDPDFFEQEETKAVSLKPSATGKIDRLLPEEVAPFLGMDKGTVRKGLQQGVFPWGYGIHTSENRWSYFINKKRFEEIEGVTV